MSQPSAGREPTVAELLELGDRARAAGDVPAAVDAYQAVLRVDAGHAGAHAGMGWARTQQRYFVDAAQHYVAAAARRPRDPTLLWHAGHLHLRNFTYEDAVGPLLRARDLDPGNVDLAIDIARAYVGLGAPQLAVPYLDEALRTRPDDAVVLSHLASALAEVGEFDRAGDLFRRVIQVGGDVAYSLFRLALNGRHEPGTALRDEIDAALAIVEAGSREEMLLHQGAYRVCADTGDWESAYEHLLASKRSTRSGLRRDHRERLEERTTRLFTREFFDERRGWGDADETPVFVVGMPRSGSTLVETVLGGHPSVVSLGERNYVDVAAHQLWYGNGEADEFERRVRALGRADVARLAEDYRRRAQMLSPRGRFTVNKMLTSYQHVGLIVLMFPRARIVHSRRSPLDSCWSIFSNPIEHGHPYASSMDDLAWTYAQSLRYMDHWRAVVPDHVIDVEYERFVADLDGETRRLLGFLGLPWSDDCLAFDRQERAVQTMSASQVRQGLYTTSIGQWRRHREFLQPLVDALLREGVIDERDLDGVA